MCKKINIVFLFTLVCIIFSLLVALAPLSDFDHDGLFDSLITEGVLLAPVFFVVSGLSFLLLEPFAAEIVRPRLFSTLFLPPPIPFGA
jgi:hypothetical protein